MGRLSAKAPSRHTVLVVDDQQESLDSVRALLEREGHRVLTAISAVRALERLKQEEAPSPLAMWHRYVSALGL